MKLPSASDPSPISNPRPAPKALVPEAKVTRESLTFKSTVLTYVNEPLISKSPATVRSPLKEPVTPVMSPPLIAEAPTSIAPKVEAIEPVSRAPTLTSAESPTYAEASDKLNAGVASTPPRDNSTPPKSTESFTNLALAIAPDN